MEQKPMIFMITHYYKKRRYNRFSYGTTTNMTYKLLCNDKWVEDTRTDKSKPMAVTAYRQVTCPHCLVILMPKQQKILDEMKKNFDLGQEFLSRADTETGSIPL